jgi:hypothetical protein
MGNCRYIYYMFSIVSFGLLLVVFQKHRLLLTIKKEEEYDGNQKGSRTSGLLGKL